MAGIGLLVFLILTKGELGGGFLGGGTNSGVTTSTTHDDSGLGSVPTTSSSPAIGSSGDGTLAIADPEGGVCAAGSNECSAVPENACAKYQDASVCFYGEAKKMYITKTGALTGTLNKAVADGVTAEKWHTNQLKDSYKSSPAFLLFATPADIENTIHSNTSAYACHLQVTSSGSLNVGAVKKIIKEKASSGDVCSGLLINTLGENAAASIFTGQGGSLSFVVASAIPGASFDQEMVHELAHISDFKYNLSKVGSLYAKMFGVLARYYPKELSPNIIEQKLQDNNICFGSALLLADRVKEGDKIIQPYNIASSANEVFAYSATSSVVSSVADQLNYWLARVTNVATRNKCRQEVKNLSTEHIEYTTNYGGQL